MLMKYQNVRGGRVKLQSILMPVMEFDNPEKGDALYAMELALSLEKLTNEKLLDLHKAAQDCNDAQMTDYVESTFLSEQVAAIKQVSEYVAQLRRIGKVCGTSIRCFLMEELLPMELPWPDNFYLNISQIFLNFFDSPFPRKSTKHNPARIFLQKSEG